MALSPQENNSTSTENNNDTRSESGSEKRYTDKRWTLGNSAELVEGQQKESPVVAAAWIVIPTAIVFAILALAFN